METVKNFYFKVILKGRGVVNGDGSNMKSYLKEQYEKNYDGKDNPYSTNNITIAKSNYYEGGVRKLKISSDCIKHSLFKNLTMNGLPNSNGYLQQYFIASPEGQLRGYMFAKEGTNGIVKKSPFTLTDAEDTGNTPIIPETYSASGPRDDTSFYAKENVGEVEYAASGAINPKDIFFLSATDFYGRKGIPEEWVEEAETPSIFQQTMKTFYGSLPYTTGYYTSSEKVLSDKVGEFGLHFNEKYVKSLIVNFFTRLLAVHIERHKAFADVVSLEIKPVFDCVRDKFYDDDDSWISVKSVEDIETLVNKYEIEDCWTPCSDQYEAKKLCKEIEEAWEKEKKAKKEAKKAEEEAKKAKKEAKKAKKESEKNDD